MKLTYEELKKALDYNPETGVFIWRERDDRSKRWNARYSGKRAGYIKTEATGYRRKIMCINDIMYKSGRLAWLYMTGEWPTGVVDHKDRDATNDAWTNLRDVTQAINRKNSSFMSNNTSGVTGVSWNKARRKWRAQVKCNGVNQYLGSFDEDDIDLAAMVVMELRAEHGFHPSHGLQR